MGGVGGDRAKGNATTRVRVFVDHWNFAITWQEMTGRSHQEIPWAELPHAVITALDSISWLSSSPKEMRAVNVYASISPKDSHEEREFANWLRYDLDQLPGYTVKVSVRQKRTVTCRRGHSTIHFVEKGVDTKIACDMLALAMRDLYDVGVLISDDADLIPSIECVQDVLDKQIVHLGFEGCGGQVRSAAWSHLLLGNLALHLSDGSVPKIEPVIPA